MHTKLVPGPIQCERCLDCGWYHTWIEDPTDDYLGGYEGPEEYCDCEAARLCRERDGAKPA